MFSKQLLSLAVLSALVTFASAQDDAGDICMGYAYTKDGDTCDTFAAGNNVPRYAACPL
jgi:hypothetical protein